VWDVAKKTKLVEPAEVSINKVHLSRDGHFVGAACSDGSVRLWDVETGEVHHILREQKPPGESIDTLGAPYESSATNQRGFLDFQFDPNGLWIAGVNDKGRLCVWDIETGDQLIRWKLEPVSRTARLTVSRDGTRLGVFGLDGTVRLFDLTIPPAN
jgi:WD40 repeat protein